MNIRTTILGGVAAIALMATAPAFAQATSGSSTTGATSDTSGMSNGSTSTGTATGTTMHHHMMHHHMMHHRSSMSGDNMSEDAKTKQLNEQQMSNPGSTGMSGGMSNSSTMSNDGAKTMPDNGMGGQAAPSTTTPH